MPSSSSNIKSAAVLGLDARLISVEADISPGLHSFTIVGLPGASVQESKQRVSAAIKNSGFIPPRRSQSITINLAPADLKKQGPAYDLPIAIGFLTASGQLFFDFPNKIFIGELSLDGSLRPVAGVLAIALLAKKLNKELFLPWANAKEAALVKNLKIFPAKTLGEMFAHLSQKLPIKTFNLKPTGSEQLELKTETDFSLIKGQEQTKRAIEIAAAGGHNILLNGPPGSGKTLLARAMNSILPELNWDESLEVTRIYSISGNLPQQQPLITRRPFRSPHHSASAVSLIGGGTWPHPGEITLAHRGILFLDELPEFPRQILESLRQPLEDKVISLSRANFKINFPANFMLVAAMNPCPCGFLTDPNHECTCLPGKIWQYRKKISGPLLDRIDMHVEVPAVDYRKLLSPDSGENSEVIKKRVKSAREKQKNLNANLDLKSLEQRCQLDSQGKSLIQKAASQFNLSARSYHKVLKIARTIADLEAEENIQALHIAEALQYRPKTEVGN